MGYRYKSRLFPLKWTVIWTFLMTALLQCQYLVHVVTNFIFLFFFSQSQWLFIRKVCRLRITYDTSSWSYLTHDIVSSTTSLFETLNFIIILSYEIIYFVKTLVLWKPIKLMVCFIRYFCEGTKKKDLVSGNDFTGSVVLYHCKSTLYWKFVHDQSPFVTKRTMSSWVVSV